MSTSPGIHAAIWPTLLKTVFIEMCLCYVDEMMKERHSLQYYLHRQNYISILSNVQANKKIKNHEWIIDNNEKFCPLVVHLNEQILSLFPSLFPSPSSLLPILSPILSQILTVRKYLSPKLISWMVGSLCHIELPHQVYDLKPFLF